jgi:integrase/recombinase XerD
MTAASTALAVVPQHDLAVPTTAEGCAAAFIAGYASSATRQAYTRDLKAWWKHLADIRVEVYGAHRVHVELFARRCEAAGAAPGTVARRLSTVSSYYQWLEEEDLVPKNPVRRVKRPRVSDESPRTGLDRAETRAFLAAAARGSRRDHALGVLLCLSGLRVSEAIGARVEDLHHERGHRTLRVHRSKTQTTERIALAPRTAAAIDALIDGRESGFIFETASHRQLDRHAARKIIARLGRAAGISRPVFPHLMRHGYVTQALDAGVPLEQVAHGAGHKNVQTTLRYARGIRNLDRSPTFALAAWLDDGEDPDAARSGDSGGTR